MSQVFILKLLAKESDGRLSVLLQHGKEGEHLAHEIKGYLPDFSALSQLFDQWQKAFRREVDPFRPRGVEKRRRTSESLSNSEIDCQALAKKLEQKLNNWLDYTDPDWRKIRDTLVEKVKPDDRVIIQTDISELRKLPLSAWEVFKNKNVEPSISKLGYQKIEYKSCQKDLKKILVVLGESTDLNTEVDDELIRKLQKKRILVKPIYQPSRKDFFKLLKEGWHILFFSGHSESDMNGEIGWIHLNKHEKLEISEFKETLKEEIKKGLQLVVFNSCSGLGLANQLAKLNLPQSIVMREEVPDRVAQDFLEHFLENYWKGFSIYSSVIQAKKELEFWEKSYPGVSWLPVIWQNPGAIAIKKQNNRFYWIALAALIIALLFTANYVVDRHNYNIYENPSKGIRLKYPKQWERDDTEEIIFGSVVTFYAPLENQSDSFQEKISVRVKDLPRQFTNLDEYKDFALAKIDESRDIQSSSYTKLADSNAYQVIYTDQEEQKIKWQEIWMIKNNQVYTINYAAGQQDFERFKQTFNKFLNSFQVKNKQ